MQATFAAAAQVLAPPFQQLTTNAYTTVMRGAYRGYVAQVDFQYPRDEREVEVVFVSVSAATYDAVLRVYGRQRGRTIVLNLTPGQRPKGVADMLSWDPAFRERFTVGGAPGVVLREWLTPDLQAMIVRSPISRLVLDGGRLEVSVMRPAAQAVAIAAALDVAIAMIERLPRAIHAAGAGQYLALGSLASHPDVVALRGFEKRSSRVWGCVGLALVVVVLGIGAAWFAACQVLGQ